MNYYICLLADLFFKAVEVEVVRFDNSFIHTVTKINGPSLFLKKCKEDYELKNRVFIQYL
jgi:hypothetical protein